MLVMLCTAGRGGMRSVVEAYRRDGLFDRHDVRLIETHDEGSLGRRLRMAASALASFMALLLRRQVDLVHVHMAMRGSFWRKSVFATLARWFGVPVVAHLHGSEMEVFYNGLGPFWQRQVVRQLEACARVLVLSDSWHAFVTRIAPRARVQVLPNYVKVPAEPAQGQGGAQVTVLFLGLVGRRKGVFDLLPAMARAVVDAPQLRLLLGGNGEVAQAQQQADELNLGKQVQFLGWVAGEQKEQLLRQADVYILPSHNEGLPMSVLEAMSYGLPVVTTRVGGIPELVTDGEDGLLVDAGDVAAIAAALVRLAQQPAERARLGAAARARVLAAYSDATVLPQLERVYAEVSAGRQRH